MGGPRATLSLLAVGAAVAVTLPALASGTTRSAGVYPTKRLHVTAASVVNFRQLARLDALRPHPAGPLHPGLMPEPQEVAEPNAQITLPSPFVESLGLPDGLSSYAPSPSPVQSFLAQADAPRVGTTTSFIPPDTMGAVGPTKLMSTLNSNYVIEQKSGGALVSDVSMTTFWGSVGAAHPFDPKTFYDPYNNRWIVAAVNDPLLPTSSILYGISDSNDPSGTWHLYNVDADAANLTWADYPGVGFNKNSLAITVNMFTNTSPSTYAGRAQLYVVNYPALVAHTAAAGTPTAIKVPLGFTIQPAVTYSPTENTLYMVEHGVSGSATYYLYALNGTALSGGTSPFVNPLGGWTIPGSANVLPQSGGHPVDAGDSRIINAVYRNGHIYYVQTIGVGGSNFNPGHTAVQWVELNTAGGFVQGGRINNPTATSSNGGHWYAYPSIAVNKNEDVLVGFSEFQSNDSPDAGYAYHGATDPPNTMRDPVTLKDGEGNYNKMFSGSRNRWGDYSATEVDPSDDATFWTTDEYAGPTPAGASCTPTACGRWSTWWGEVQGTPLTPTNCVVPNVIGKKLALAKSAITSKHCRVGRVAYVKSTKRRKGRVIRQQPGAGKTLATGSKVNLWVGRGPKRR